MDKKSERKRPGPKPKGPFEGKRKTLTTRITENTRTALEDAATQNDRSLSQEIEFRLAKSFLDERSEKDQVEQLVTIFDGIENMRTAAKIMNLIEFYGDIKPGWRADKIETEILADMVSKYIERLGYRKDAPVAEFTRVPEPLPGNFNALNEALRPRERVVDDADAVAKMMERSDSWLSSRRQPDIDDEEES